MIDITYNGVISYISERYGGKASDIFIVNTSGLLIFLQPNYQVVADRVFEIQEILDFHQCTLCIPPCKYTNLQMTKEKVAKTSKIANLQIYVKQVIKRMKDYNILSNELKILNTYVTFSR